MIVTSVFPLGGSVGSAQEWNKYLASNSIFYIKVIMDGISKVAWRVFFTNFSQAIFAS